jgi:4-amino-4-deoxy-L-arabinose transferase-like glycosyltransferase
MSDGRRFWPGLVAITAGGLAVRVFWVVLARWNFALLGDDFFYHWQARAIADGHGFINPLVWRGLGRMEPSAEHPPLYSSYLAVVSWFGGTSPATQRLASCLLGAGAVMVVGLAARRIAGQRAGLLAAAVAAVYPMLWINDGMLISESMYALTIAAVLLAAYRFWSTRSWLNAAFLGGAIALATLTRPEAILLLPLIGVPFVLADRSAWRTRLVNIGTAAAVTIVVLAPWVVRNLVVFEKPVYITSGTGMVTEISNCDKTYSGPMLGYWHIDCTIRRHPPTTPQQRELLQGKNAPGIVYLVTKYNGDESVRDGHALHDGLSYIRGHNSRFPVVALARAGRVWGVFRPGQTQDFDVFFERRGRKPTSLGSAMYYCLVAIGAYALIVMRKRAIPISPMIAIALMVTFTSIISIGITRYRVAADVALTVLAGVALDALWSRLSPASVVVDRAEPLEVPSTP